MESGLKTDDGEQLSRADLIARIIDPVSFEKVRQGGQMDDAQWRCNRARDKAAHIETLFATRAPSGAALVEALEERVELLQSALLEIAEKDWHARTPPKPRADGGMRGWAGHLAVWALTGLHGSYSGDDAVRAALAAAKGQQP